MRVGSGGREEECVRVGMRGDYIFNYPGFKYVATPWHQSIL